jgi:hypothetical protein
VSFEYAFIIVVSSFPSFNSISSTSTYSSLVKDNFNPFTYNFNNDNRNRPVSSTIESLGLKHALNIELPKNIVFVNEEKGYYMDENKSGICYGKTIFK